MSKFHYNELVFLKAFKCISPAVDVEEDSS